MADIPTVRGTRILTREQIRGLPDHRLGAYRRKMHVVRREAHGGHIEAEIRALDYLCIAIIEEVNSRKDNLAKQNKDGKITLSEWLEKEKVL